MSWAVGWVGWSLALAALLTLRRRMARLADAEHELRGAATAIALLAELTPPLRLELDRLERGAGGPGRGPRGAAGATPADLEAGRLAQVLGNVAANAAEHGLGPVAVRARREGAVAWLEVANGDGAAPAPRPAARRRPSAAVAVAASGSLGGRPEAGRAADRRARGRRHARGRRVARGGGGRHRAPGGMTPTRRRGLLLVCFALVCGGLAASQVQRARAACRGGGRAAGVRGGRRSRSARGAAPGLGRPLGQAGPGPLPAARRAAGRGRPRGRAHRGGGAGRRLSHGGSARAVARPRAGRGRCGPASGRWSSPWSGAGLEGADMGARVDVLVTTEGGQGEGRTFVALEDAELLALRPASGAEAAGGGAGEGGHRRGGGRPRGPRHAPRHRASGRLPHRGLRLGARGAPARPPARRPGADRVSQGICCVTGSMDRETQRNAPRRARYPGALSTSTEPSARPSSARSAYPMNRPCSTTPGTSFTATASASRSASEGSAQSRIRWPSSVT